MSNLKCALVGLPNVGKSTVFNALTKLTIAAENYPFCTIDPNLGIVPLPDERLGKLAALTNTAKIVPATVSFVDIAGLVAGASKGEGLGNQFLSNIRETDLIVQVVRCFEDENVVHVDGKVDPLHDIEVINLELVLADMQMCEKAMVKLTKQAKGDKEKQLALKTMEKALAHLNGEQPLRTLDLSDEELESVKMYNFLTMKRVLYVANVSEDDLPEMENSFTKQVREYAEKEGSEVVPVCAKLEAELVSLSDEEACEFLESVGLNQSGLDRLIQSAFHLLDLLTFLTTGEVETRAWVITRGMKAPEAAGKIHTDIQKGFIRAEVITYSDLIDCQTRTIAKEKGLARMEGKDYVVQDNDVILFYHNQ
ncbi:MAG: Ribosome-binding ATPase YchF [Chlamydiia bacterium]|nr:Ribosome-binding ATPase YchF [Chlamydiia bacterium]